MRIIAIVFSVLAMWAGPALAQTAPDAARQSRLALSERYLELTQGGDLIKEIREQLEADYGETELPEAQRVWFVERMTVVLEEVVAATLVELRDDVADSFTSEELETAIAFYDSPVGRSVVRKQMALNAELQQIMMRLLMPRVTELMEKYCLRFDCSAAGAAAAKRQD
jgi:uncharacterized protein